MPRTRKLVVMFVAGAVMVATMTAAGTTAALGSGKTAVRHGVKANTSKTPGALITSRLVSAPGVNGSVYVVEYWSESVPANKPVKVSGLVIIPPGTAPVGGWPVVTWAHPTAGMVGSCAPSLNPSTDVPYANDLLAQGWVVTASDYLNMNSFASASKKLLPFLVGAEAARNTIDIVRAARNVSAAHAGSNYQVLGWSEGGQTAMFVSHIATSYAPELTLKGTVGMAIPSQFTSLTSYLATTSYWPFLLMIAAGYNTAYGNATAPLASVVTHTGKKLIGSALKKEPGCISGILATMPSQNQFNQVMLSGTFPPAWQTLLNQNDPGTFTAAGPAPVLMVHGSTDNLVPPSTSATLATQLCGLGAPQPLERWIYSGLDHVSLVTSGDAVADINQWMSDRFAAGAWPDPYVPTGNGMVTVTQTNTC